MSNLFETWAAVPEGSYRQANAWVQQCMQDTFWSAADVENLYKISRVNQNHLRKAGEGIPGHVTFSGNHYYVLTLAKPWFDAYVAKQTARASTREAKKQPKKKRVTKKDRWKHFNWEGQACVVPEGIDHKEFNTVMVSWLLSRFGYTREQWQSPGASDLEHYTEALALLRQWQPIAEKMRSMYLA